MFSISYHCQDLTLFIGSQENISKKCLYLNHKCYVGMYCPTGVEMLDNIISRDEDPTFFSTDPDPAGKKMRIRIRHEIEMKKKYI